MKLLRSVQEKYASSDPGDRPVGVTGKAFVEVTAGTLVGGTVAGGLFLLDISVREIAVFQSPSVSVTVVGGVALLFVRWFECEVIRDGNDPPDGEGDTGSDRATGRDGSDGDGATERDGSDDEGAGHGGPGAVERRADEGG